MPAGAVIKGQKDGIAVVIELFETAEREVDFIAPPSMLSIAGTYGTLASATRFIQSGGVVRGVTTITPANREEMQMRLDAGFDLRHYDMRYELFMFVADRQKSISAINIGVEEYTFDTPITAFWSDNPSYAEYLLASFESVWAQAIPAKQRIQELEKETE